MKSQFFIDKYEQTRQIKGIAFLALAALMIDSKALNVMKKLTKNTAFSAISFLMCVSNDAETVQPCATT